MKITKPLVVTVKLDIRQFRAGFRIDNRESAFAITDKHMAALRIDADIIRITAKINATQQR